MRFLALFAAFLLATSVFAEDEPKPMPEEVKIEEETKTEENTPKEETAKTDQKKEASDDKDPLSGTTRVKLPISVTRFNGGSAGALVSYLFFFETKDRNAKEKIYQNIKGFQGYITPELTQFLSTANVDPKDIIQIKKYMWRLANKAAHKVINKTKALAEKNKKEVYITDVFINKVFERKL